MKKKDLITKWLDNQPLTETESEAFKNLDAYDSYVKLSETAKSFKAPAYHIEDNLETLKTSLSNHKKEAVREKSSLRILLRIAAVFILGIGSYFTFFHSSDTIVEALASQKTSTELPDQSQVKLNAGSSIQYNKKDWDNHRKIALKGEAYFKVAKGKTFAVETSSGIVQVLGTEFNVKNRQNYFEVICYEGKVRVIHNKDTITLIPGNGIKVLNNQKLSLTTTLSQPEWIANKSTFTSMPFSHVLKEFERQYDMTIIANNINQNTLFTGNFVHSNIQTALQSITIPMRLKYKINDNVITLYKE